MCSYEDSFFVVMDELNVQAGFEKIFSLAKVFGFESSPFVPLMSLEITGCTIYVFFKDRIDCDDKDKQLKYSLLQKRADQIMRHLPDEVEEIIKLLRK